MVIANSAPDLYASLIAVGVMGHIALQVVLNICVVTNWMPNTGIILPFISYGGTSVAILLSEMGAVLNVSRQIVLMRHILSSEETCQALLIGITHQGFWRWSYLVCHKNDKSCNWLERRGTQA